MSRSSGSVNCLPCSVVPWSRRLYAHATRVGPKKIRFRGRVTVETDLAALTGSLRGRGAADMRAARIGVHIAYALRADPAKPDTTLVKLTSDAELGGVLADFARTGGIPFANASCAANSCNVGTRW